MRVAGELYIEQIGLCSHAGALVRALAERLRRLDARLGQHERESIPRSMPPGLIGRKPSL